MRRNKKILGVLAVVVVVAVAGAYMFNSSQTGSLGEVGSDTIPQPDLAKSELKDLPVAPENKRVDIQKPVFSNPTKITNPLFPVNDLKQAILLGNDDGRPLQVMYTLLPESKNRVIGWDGKKIETRTVQYLAYFDRRLIEYAYDWYAQADDGSIWYFGEDVFNMADGVITDTHGTWLAGKDGPVAMIMPANPRVGNVYRVENIPGVAFEEVEVKSVNTTLEGPLGTVTGCMIGTQLHDNGSYSDKTFCPGYGEFFTEKDLDLEAVAFAVPADVLKKPMPAELSNITSSALRIYDAVENDEWYVVEIELAKLKTAWSAFRNSPDKVSTRFVSQMDRAIRGLEGDAMEPAALAGHKIGAQNGAIDVLFAGLDLEMRYRPYAEIDVDRAGVWARKTLIDAQALEHGFVLSDASAFEFLLERVAYTLPRDKADRMIVLVKELRIAADAEDFEAVLNIAKQLLDI